MNQRTMFSRSNNIFQLAKHPARFRLFLFFRIPSAFFAGIRIQHLDTDECVVTVPYTWFSKNPFGSTYFACLSMAAEMSSGALCMTALQEKTKSVSLLVVQIKSDYLKKAQGLTIFCCKDGKQIHEAVQKALATKSAQTVVVRSVGQNKAGEVVAEFQITWSFKVRSTAS